LKSKLSAETGRQTVIVTEIAHVCNELACIKEALQARRTQHGISTVWSDNT